jgi:hypothetical protein
MTAETLYAGLLAAVLLAGLWTWRESRRETKRARICRNQLLHFDPAKTAGGRAGKGYTAGGFGREVFYIPNETAVEPTREERLP